MHMKCSTSSRIHAVKISHVRWDGESNENGYENLDIDTAAKGIDYGVVQWIMCGTLRNMRT